MEGKTEIPDPAESFSAKLFPVIGAINMNASMMLLGESAEEDKPKYKGQRAVIYGWNKNVPTLLELSVKAGSPAPEVLVQTRESSTRRMVVYDWEGTLEGGFEQRFTAMRDTTSIDNTKLRAAVVGTSIGFLVLILLALMYCTATKEGSDTDASSSEDDVSSLGKSSDNI